MSTIVVTASGEHGTGTRKSYRKACDRCHASKLKCISADSSATFSECTRCLRARMTCTYSQRATKPVDTSYNARLDDCETWTFDAQATMPLSGFTTTPVEVSGQDIILQQDQIMSDLSMATEDIFGPISQHSTASYFPPMSGDLTGSTHDMSGDVIDFVDFSPTHGTVLDGKTSTDYMYRLDGYQSASIFTQLGMNSDHQQTLTLADDTFSNMHQLTVARCHDECGVMHADTRIESILLSHSRKLIEHLDMIADASSCSKVPSTSEELLRVASTAIHMMHQTGRKLKDILQLSQSRLSQRPQSTEPSTNEPLRQRSITMLAVFCYASYLQICARQFSDLCNFLRLNPALRKRANNQFYNGRQPPAAKDAMLDMMKSFIDHPLCYIYAAMKSIVELIQSIELLMELQPIIGLSDADGASITIAQFSSNDSCTVAERGSRLQIKSSLSTKLISALIEDEGYDDQRMSCCAVLQRCIQETKELMKDHLDL